MVAPALSSPTSVGAKLGAKVGAYVALTKPRIIELLLVTTVPTMVVAEQGIPPLWLVVATVVGGTLAAGGANAINMYVDRDIDALMERTQGRPLVTGAVSPASALVFAISIEVLAFVFLWQVVNLLSAVLAVSACLFYVFVYTLWLKRTSSSNIVIGGAAGAVPVLVGWSAVTDSVSWSAIVLFGVIFFWTPPHFWALAIKYKDDYARADVPMLPSVASHRQTTDRILAYSVVVWALTLVLGVTADLGLLYWAAAIVLGGVLTGMAVELRRTESPARAIRLFTFSITYITLLFGAMAVDVIIRNGW
jgi:protoheme IX farnesyltransferase